MENPIRNWYDQYTKYTRRIEDWQASKKIPNSIRAIIRSIRKSWDCDDDSERSVLDFSKSFWPTFKDIAGRYPGNKVRNVKPEDTEIGDIKGIINRLEHNRADISFYQLRAFSHYIGLPTGLFLLYCQALGDATRERGNPEDTINLLECSIDALQDLRDSLMARQTLQGYMYESIEDGEYGLEYRAILDPLRQMVSGFVKSRVAPAGSR